MTTTPAVCPECHEPVTPGYVRHAECLRAYRASVDYRRLALNRDGYACARCPAWWNRAVTATYTTRWEHTPSWARPHIRQHRPVDVDHIDPLGAGGSHDPANLQVLCKRHHRAKTKRDLARMKGRRVPRPALTAALLTLIIAAAWLYDQLARPGHSALIAPAAALATITGLALFTRARLRHRVMTRLREAVAHVTGDSLGKRRSVIGKRWRLTRAGGQLIPRLRPTRITVNYPWTFPDHDPAKQTELEAKITAKVGGTWVARWNTTTDRVRLASPDPLVALGGIPWPNTHAPTLDLWNPIPVGVAENGDPITVTLPGKNLLIGGEPEAGKSVAQSLITATGALDPETTVHGIDGKGLVELGPWRDSMENLVGSGDTGQQDATDLLDELRHDVMNLRYDLLYREGRRSIERGDGLGLHLVIIDELAAYTASGPKQARDKFTEALRDLIQRGRAAGVIVVAATQRPSADVIPTSIRDLIGYRWALRCTTPQSSDMVLGQGQASAGYSAAKIASAHRGMGLLLTEGSEPRRLRSYLIDTATLHGLAGRAAALRAAGQPSEPEQDPSDA